tara:strand:+ start:18902 stop:19114 length:213 start_codon:yes stop_codon:yes gene_type:complete
MCYSQFMMCGLGEHTSIPRRTKYMSQEKDTPNNSEQDKPEQGKQYRLTGGNGVPSIANGNSWAESEVKND